MHNLTQDIPSPTPSPLPSDEILARKAAVEQEAFTILYQRYIGPVYRYLYARHGNRQDAEDLAAQVFLAALEGLSRFREEGSFAAWLFSIARHKSAEYFRRWRPLANVESEPSLVDHSPEPQALVESSQELDALREKVANLGADEQELLRLRFAAGLSFDQIARLLGRNQPAVKMALYRLLDRLGQAMGRENA